MSIVDRTSKKNAEQNLWETFLSEAKLGDNFQDSHVLFLGPRNTGKRSLINSIFQNVISNNSNNNKVGIKGNTSALEYTYILVKNPEDPENDDHISKMNIWILDEPNMSGLLSHCLREDTIENMMICICLDMAEPWQSLSTLSEWMNIISERVTRIYRDMPLYKQDKLREKLARYIKIYEQPKFDEEGKLIVQKKKKDEKLEEETIDIPLPEGVLTTNFGIPFMILGTKADELEVLEKEKEGEYKLDFLQHALRSFGLPYGAALLYVSLKQNINLDILYDYLIHRLYGFGLKYAAEVIHKDSIFIPSGYDKPKIISETFQNIKSTDIFEEVISQPARKKAQFKEEITTEDTQAFLQKLKVKMQSSQEGKEASRDSTPSNIEKDKSPAGSTANIPGQQTTSSEFFNSLRQANAPAKPNGEVNPSHVRTASHQISPSPSSITDLNKAPTTQQQQQQQTTATSKNKQSRAEKLMELLKK